MITILPRGRTSFCSNDYFSLPINNKRYFSTVKPPVITDYYIARYDYFKSLPISEKISCLTHRCLNLLMSQTGSQRSIEEKWKGLQKQYIQKGEKLVDYDGKNPEDSFKSILSHIKIPNIIDPNQPLSSTTKEWAKASQFSYPLEGELTLEQQFVSQVLPRYIKEKTALIGAATWGGNETFYFLRALANHQKERSFIHYVSNIEVNSLNARLAYIVGQELGLDPKRFQSIEGNALTALPHIPAEIKAIRQTIIACRFIPTLTYGEISSLMMQICKSLSSTEGCAILTFSTLSLSDWERPQSATLKKLIEICKERILKTKEIRGNEGELLGVSFINSKDGNTFQTFLFQEKIEQFFLEQRVKIIEQKTIGIESYYQRETVILTPYK